MNSRLKALGLGLLLLTLACSGKVKLGRLMSETSLFESFWFEREATLYVFYRVTTTERLRNTAALEYQVDDGPWTTVQEAPLVHPHRAIDCGVAQRCGSLSLSLNSPPARVGLRLRYNPAGRLADVFQKNPTLIRRSSTAPDRSFYVYGFFDSSNQFIGWRGRNAFPGLAHEEAVALGLQRPFSSQDLQARSNSSAISTLNPPLYGAFEPCTGSPLATNLLRSIQGEDIWEKTPFPTTFPEACATITSKDALGAVNKSAIARKNPVVSDINRNLALRFTEATLIPLVFASCDNPDPVYLSFQKDRLGISSKTVDICLESQEFNVNNLRQFMLARIREARNQSNRNLALLIILHYKEPDSAPAIASILSIVLDQVLDDQINPRIAATFVYDSFPLAEDALIDRPQLVWCPTLNVEEETLSSCFFTPAQVTVGPLEFRTTPLLPDYTSFQSLDEEQRSGITVSSLRVLTPAEPEVQERLDVLRSADGGYWMFHPDDIVTLDSSESLSFCARNDKTSSLAYREIQNEIGSYSAPARLQELPRLQNSEAANRSVQIGLYSPLPFYLALSYRTRLAIGPKNLTGILAITRQVPVTDSFGALILQESQLDMNKVLARCTQYCQHPAFDDSGNYLLSRAWNIEFQTRCYEPQIPPIGGP